jgi:hypothetical protein
MIKKLGMNTLTFQFWEGMPKRLQTHYYSNLIRFIRFLECLVDDISGIVDWLESTIKVSPHNVDRRFLTKKKVNRKINGVKREGKCLSIWLKLKGGYC